MNCVLRAGWGPHALLAAEPTDARGQAQGRGLITGQLPSRPSPCPGDSCLSHSPVLQTWTPRPGTNVANSSQPLGVMMVCPPNCQSVDKLNFIPVGLSWYQSFKLWYNTDTRIAFRSAHNSVCTKESNVIQSCIIQIKEIWINYILSFIWLHIIHTHS